VEVSVADTPCHDSCTAVRHNFCLSPLVIKNNEALAWMRPAEAAAEH
jgi:hypothetical protein